MLVEGCFGSVWYLDDGKANFFVVKRSMFLESSHHWLCHRNKCDLERMDLKNGITGLWIGKNRIGNFSIFESNLHYVLLMTEVFFSTKRFW